MRSFLGEDLKVELSHEQFNELIHSLVKRSLLTCRRALKDAHVEAEDDARSGYGWRLNSRLYVREQVGNSSVKRH